MNQKDVRMEDYEGKARSILASSKSYPVRLRGHPVGHRLSTHGVAETGHPRDGDPAVLAEPSIFATGSSTRTCSWLYKQWNSLNQLCCKAKFNKLTTIGRSCVIVSETLVARQDGRGAIRVS